MMKSRIRKVLPAGLLGVLASLQVASASPAAGAEPFDYFRNSWNVIGLKDYRDGTRVTPDNQLMLSGPRSLQIRFGTNLTLLGRRQTKTLRNGWLPVIELTAQDGPMRYDFVMWASPLPTVSDWKKAFDWPVEGENYLNWIQVKVTHEGREPCMAGVRLEQVQGDASSGRKTDVLLGWQEEMKPNQTREVTHAVPFAPVRAEEEAAWSKEKASVWLKRTIGFWEDLLDGGAQITVPCQKATDTLRAAHVCQLIANDHGEMHAGEGFYDEFYIRDAAYQLMELEEAGFDEASRKAVECYLRSQRPDGRFETQANQFDANGQALWTLWQYYLMTRDRAWLERAYPQMRRGVEWAMQARRQAPTDSPYVGLLPAAPADGEYLWDGTHHIVGYDVWNLRGMLVTAEAAAAMGRIEEAEELAREATAYREAIDAGWKRTGLAHFPPSWEKDGTHWGNTETLWPTELYAADDSRVEALIRHARREHGGGFHEGVIRWLGHAEAIHPYLSAYTTMADLIRGNHEQVVEDFYWYLLHSSASQAFPEGIYYRRRFAWGDTIPHATGASNYALLLRHMLMHEQGGVLHLLPAVPDWWLEEGQEIRVQRAPTHFGLVSFTLRGEAEGVRLKWSAPKRLPPAQVVLHLPASRPLVGNPPRGVTVSGRSDQVVRWDFPAVVARYEELAGAAWKPIPGLVSLPLAKDLAAAQCRLLDLSGLANTDPFTAPFGVANPGKYLFTGLPLGEQTVAGIPFRVIDPKENGGRALVVLHSERAPAERDWPREVVIPVGGRGRRVFLLGNVHGWALEDAGTGPWGAVGEYAIHYEDGQIQTVPLITGRTADDWAGRPEAEEVMVGLRGEPWHLNVMGVTLRPVAVEKIVFRDLGTPAAPVLAAVTLEE